MRKIIDAIAIAILVLLASLSIWKGFIQPVNAQQLCTNSPSASSSLTQIHGEKLKATALIGTGIMEIYVSETGSFTLLVKYPNGLTCFREIGTMWKDELPEGDDL